MLDFRYQFEGFEKRRNQEYLFAYKFLEMEHVCGETTFLKNVIYLNSNNPLAYCPTRACVRLEHITRDIEPSFSMTLFAFPGSVVFVSTKRGVEVLSKLLVKQKSSL